MGYITKIQGIQRDNSQQLYVNLPSALAREIGLQKGEEAEWVLGPDSQIVLKRKAPEPKQVPPKKGGTYWIAWRSS
jgi:hypothetical protein